MERLTPYVIGALLAAFGAWTPLAYLHPGPHPADLVPPRAVEGKRLWLRHNCAACHQIYGLGGFLGPDLTNAAERRGREYLRTVLREGRGEMPRLDLSGDDLSALLEFLEYAGRTGTFPPERALRGFNN